MQKLGTAHGRHIGQARGQRLLTQIGRMNFGRVSKAGGVREQMLQRGLDGRLALTMHLASGQLGQDLGNWRGERHAPLIYQHQHHHADHGLGE